ncbi:MAG: hypothetical protein OSJ70_01645 [Bacilli bacterium]|nr:hypothetical protein [Bacilli bacterium]
MKKYLVLLLIIPLIIVGCAKKKPIIEYDEEAHEKIISSIGKTNNDQVVVKFNGKDCLEYYVYDIKNINFILYNYTFFNRKDAYQEAVNKYKDNVRLEFSSDDQALVTKKMIQRGSKSDDAKDLREAIINKYKDDKNYEIIK